MDKQFVATKPKLNTCNGNMKGDWFVVFRYRNHKTGRMSNYRHYEGFKFLRTRQEREKWGATLVARYTRKLKTGWNPNDDDDVIFAVDAHQLKLKFSKQSIEHLLTTAVSAVSTAKDQHTLANYTNYIKHFTEWLKAQKMLDFDITLITCDHAEQFLNYLTGPLKLSNKTRNEHRSLLNKLFQHLFRKKLIPENPFELCINKKHYSKPRAYYKDNLREWLVDEIERRDPYLYFFIELTYYLMARRTELNKIRIRHIDLEQGKFIFDEEVAKKDIEQGVDIPQQLFKKLLSMKLNQYPEEFFLLTHKGIPGKKPIGKNYFYKRWRKIRDEFGIPGRYGLYNWKHTASVDLDKSNFNLNDIKQHGRWHSLDMVANYMEGFHLEGNDRIKTHYPDIKTARTAIMQPPQQMTVPIEQPA